MSGKESRSNRRRRYQLVLRMPQRNAGYGAVGMRPEAMSHMRAISGPMNLNVALSSFWSCVKVVAGEHADRTSCRTPPCSCCNVLDCAGVVDTRLDLLAVANNGCILEQALNVLGAHRSHVINAPAVEGVAEGVPLGQNHVPVEARLEYLEAHHLKEGVVVIRGPAPYLTGVPLPERIAPGPLLYLASVVVRGYQAVLPSICGV